mgnify:FL=1
MIGGLAPEVRRHDCVMRRASGGTENGNGRGRYPYDERKGNKEYDNTHERNWRDKGDGVVDIPSQQREGWNHVNVIPMIKGTGKGHALPINDLQDTGHSYHHVNTPDRKETADLIHSILKK